MPNTGKVITLTLKELYDHDNSPTGVTKPNSPSDPDYIAPSVDLATCPVSYTTTCPVPLTTGRAGEAEYEFSLLSSVINNPAIAKVNVKLMDGVTLIANHLYTFPHSQYFQGVFTVAADTYTLDITYLNSGNAVVANCTSVATIIVT